jgi:N-acyl-D-aspartate/D-glutamate deacylase
MNTMAAAAAAVVVAATTTTTTAAMSSPSSHLSSSSSNALQRNFESHRTSLTSLSAHHYAQAISYHRSSIARTVTTTQSYVVIVGFSERERIRPNMRNDLSLFVFFPKTIIYRIS